MLLLAGFVALNLFEDESRSVDLSSIWSTGLYLLLRNEQIKSKSVTIRLQLDQGFLIPGFPGRDFAKSRDPRIFRDGISLKFQSRDFREL